MSRNLDLRVRRIYDAPAASDGIRVLVDRRWPRGVTKARAALDEWCRDIAPSDALRRWYDHDVAKFNDFERRYRRELEDATRAAALQHLTFLAHVHRLTLLTATKKAEFSQAAVLLRVMSEGPAASASSVDALTSNTAGDAPGHQPHQG
jgi:uncharacterized protein YeaO (DUF488 family)